MQKPPAYMLLMAGPWRSALEAMYSMQEALQAEAVRVGGAVWTCSVRRNHRQSYGARGTILLRSPRKKILYYQAGVI